jgi:hypothetical protein
MRHLTPNKINNVASGGKEMAKGQNAQEQNGSEEQPQSGAEQPQTPTATATAEQPVSTAAEMAKRTPQVIAQTNIERANQLREQHKDALAARGNNMSDKIRYLHDQGLEKGDISRVLQIQFQFVRNVVFNYEQKKAKMAADAAAKATPAATNAS